jgi:hypothetical protein
MYLIRVPLFFTAGTQHAATKDFEKFILPDDTAFGRVSVHRLYKNKRLELAR